MLEGTGQLGMLLPIITTVCTARFVGNTMGEGLCVRRFALPRERDRSPIRGSPPLFPFFPLPSLRYETAIRLQGIPFLYSETHSWHHLVRASEVMAKPCGDYFYQPTHHFASLSLR